MFSYNHAGGLWLPFQITLSSVPSKRYLSYIAITKALHTVVLARNLRL
ncbi:MAG: hypothetical protein ACJAZM_000100 [Cyclobacteriaceae bacterium]|jgi:hypothetical protein